MTRADRGTLRWLRRVLYGAGAVVALALVLIASFLLLAPVREVALRAAWPRIERAVPGTLTTGKIRWPLAGTLEIDRLLWTSGADSAVAAERIEVAVDLRALWRRDLWIRRLNGQGLRLDLATLASLFPPPAAEKAPSQEGGRGGGFLRTGPIAPVPSLAIDRIDLTIPAIRLPDRSTLRDLRLVALLEHRHGHNPTARIDSLRASSTEPAWSIEEAALGIDLERGRIDGIARATFASTPVAIGISSPRDQQILLVATADGETATPPEGIGVLAELNLVRRDLIPSRIAFDLQVRTPGTEELERFLDPARLPENLPDLEGVTADVTGAADLEPSLGLDGSLVLRPNAWLEGGGGRFAFRNGIFSADSVTLRIADLSVAAQSSLTAGEVDGAVEIRCLGPRWLATLLPAVEAPRSLLAEIQAEARGPIEQLQVQLDLRASAATDDFRLDEVALHGRSIGTTGNLELTAQALDFQASLEADLDWANGIAATLSPIRILDRAARQPAVTAGGRAGSLRLAPDFTRLSASNLSIVGAFGRIDLDGDFHKEAGGSARIRADWPSPPSILLTRLTPEPNLRDSLRQRWREDGPFGVAATVDLNRSGDRSRIVADVRLELPGPRSFRPILPEGIDVGSLDQLIADALVRFDIGGGRQTIEGRLDLGQTAWIDTGLVAIRGDRVDWTIDRLLLSSRGTRVEARGSLGAERLDVVSRIEMPDAALLRSVLAETTDSLEATFRLDARLQGTPESPEASADLTGRLGFGAWRVAHYQGTATYEGGRLVADIDLPEGLQHADFRLDRAAVRYRSEADSLLPARIELDASGKEFEIHQRARFASDSLLRVDVDTLDLRVTDRRLRNRHPFRLMFGGSQRAVAISDLDLAGSLGSLRADGRIGADSVDLRFEFEADAPEKPSFVDIEDPLWPDFVSLKGRAIGRDRVEADLVVSGLEFADREEIHAQLGIVSDGDRVEGVLDVVDARGSLIAGRASLPVAVRTSPLGLTARDGKIEAQIDLTALPVPIEEGVIDLEADDRPARLDGQIRLNGTMEKPAADALLTLSFPGWRRLGNYRAMVTSAVADTIRSSLLLERAGKRILENDLRLPVSFTLQPPSIGLREGAELTLRTRSTGLNLADFNELLPAYLGLDGSAQIRLDASGPVADPTLEGSLRTEKLEVSMANGTRARADIDVALSGTAKTPRVEGLVEIANGVIRIPEEQKNLHSATGTAMLWEIEPEPTGDDSTQLAIARPDSKPPGRDETPPTAPGIDLEVEIAIPSGLWITGRGLEVELAGRLQVSQRGTMIPTVTGELQAVRGQLVFLGRTFLVERGGAVFYGGDEINPALDLALTSRIDETLIRILVRGTAQKPELVLSSEPEMTEGDIMAFLLFGRPIDQLDSGQMALLESRAGDVASSYAIAQLQGRLTQQLGVDLVTIRRSSGDANQNALVIGKYLSRRALVKYEQALEGATNFFINLEYFLSRSFKVETFIGPQSQSGIEANWSRQF